MRIALLAMLIGAFGTAWAEDAFGVWRVTPIRWAAPYSDLVAVRFAPHAKGEVFTLDRMDADGHATTSSTILYFDGQPRELQDSGCVGTQSSRRVDRRTVEIVRTCVDGQRIRFVRRSAGPKDLVLEINAQQPNGRRLERRLILTKQAGQVVLH